MAIVEKQTIRFTPDRRLQGRSVNLGNEGDNMVRRIMFALPDVVDLSIHHEWLGNPR